ncbi:MAG: hypothetical protein OXC31_19270 [Spirochaetaceae bacterium]|nr:hypothetical protein [Spirochaetaceae bacterium]
MEMPIPVLDVMTDDLEPRSMAAEQLISGQPRMASRDLYRAGQAILIRAMEVVDRLKGPVVPVNICFADDDAIDYAACRRRGRRRGQVQISPWLGQEREVLVGYLDAIRGAAGIPLLLWGAWPDPYPIATVRELAARDEVVGIKNDGDPFYAYYDLLRATADLSFAVISGGQMRNFVLGHPLGGAAYLCTVAPFRADLALQFYGHLQAGEVNGRGR